MTRPTRAKGGMASGHRAPPYPGGRQPTAERMPLRQAGIVDDTSAATLRSRGEDLSLEGTVFSRASIVDFLEAELGVDLSGVGNADPLFSSGIVDSFALVTLMMHLEQQGGLRINPSDVTLDNFDTIDRIIAFGNRAPA